MCSLLVSVGSMGQIRIQTFRTELLSSMQRNTFLQQGTANWGVAVFSKNGAGKEGVKEPSFLHTLFSLEKERKA